jgi:serine/threonine protein kinase
MLQEVHRDRVYIFMEYCENGSLGALLDHGGRIEDEVYVVDYAYQLLSGLAYLHENNIVHRDIKPDSKFRCGLYVSVPTNLQFILDILIDYQGQLKLSDFGAAKILAKGQRTMGRTTMNMHVNSLAGTPMYMVKYSCMSMSLHMYLTLHSCSRLLKSLLGVIQDVKDLWIFGLWVAVLFKWLRVVVHGAHWRTNGLLCITSLPAIHHYQTLLNSPVLVLTF